VNKNKISPSDRKVNCQADFDYIGLRKWVLGLDKKNRLFDNGLDAIERMILLVFVEHAPIISPSLSRLVHMTGFRRTAIITRIKLLEKRGVIHVVHSNGRRSQYELNQSATRTGTPHGPVRHTDHTSPPHEPPPVRQADPKQTREAGSKAERAYLAQKTASKSKKPSSRAAPLPDAWHPTEKHRDLARQRGVDINLAADKFRAHAGSVGRTQKNWNASFRLWLLNEKPSDQTVPPAPIKYGLH